MLDNSRRASAEGTRTAGRLEIGAMSTRLRLARPHGERAAKRRDDGKIPSYVRALWDAFKAGGPRQTHWNRGLAAVLADRIRKMMAVMKAREEHGYSVESQRDFCDARLAVLMLVLHEEEREAIHDLVNDFLHGRKKIVGRGCMARIVNSWEAEGEDDE